MGAVGYNRTVHEVFRRMPPPLRDAAVRALRFPAEVHTDSCGWMGSDAAHPCTCGVPSVLRWLLERYGRDAEA